VRYFAKTISSSDSEKLTTLKVICAAVIFMVMLLAVRLAFTLLNNYLQGTTMGYAISYGVGVILPEALVCLIMLAIILYTFSPSRDGGGSSGSTKVGKLDSVSLSLLFVGFLISKSPFSRPLSGQLCVPGQRGRFWCRIGQQRPQSLQHLR
jgi:hypothetical protein